MISREKFSGYDVAIIELTTRCQCRCPGCYRVKDLRLDEDQQDLTLNEAISILDLSRQYKGQDIALLQIVGGEPLLWPHLNALIKEAATRKINCHVYSNLLAITPKLAKWLLEHKVEITGKLNINPNGGDEQLAIQGELLGGTVDTAKQLMKAIHLLLAAGYDKNLLSLNNLIRKQNLKYVPAYYGWCLDNNVSPDLELLSSGVGIQDDYWQLSPTPKKIAALIKELQDIRQKNKLEQLPVAMPHIFERCKYYQHQLYFTIEGDIKTCSTNGLPVLANIKEKDAIKKAWSSEVIKTRHNLNKKNIGEPCHSCQNWDSCLGGCRATAEGEGDLCAGYKICPLPYL